MARDVDVLESERLHFRSIDLSDTSSIVEWRSSPDTYRFFKNPKAITEESHEFWYINNYLCNDARFDWMAISEEKRRIGVFGLVLKGRTAEINYIISPSERHKGYAKEGIYRLIKYAAGFAEIERIIAEIHKDNIPSICLVQKIGFNIYESNGDFLIYEYIIDKNLYIRADANEIIGTGHIMRCLAIAEAALLKNYRTTFIIADESPKKIIEDRGFQTIVLKSSWCNIVEELPTIQKIIKERSVKNLLIDSYNVTETYLKALSVGTTYIDDINKFHYPVDALICYAVYWDEKHYLEEYEKCHLFLGPAYAPLRSEFKNIGPKIINEKIDSVLILSGATDPHNSIERLIDSISVLGFRIDAVCGAFSGNYDRLNCKYKDRSNITIHQALPNIAEYMKKADLVISAGGITLYELCACGTPTISYKIADNQDGNVKRFDRDQLIDYAGDIRNEDIIPKILSLIEKYKSISFRIDRSVRMQKLIDGGGADRIANMLIDLSYSC